MSWPNTGGDLGVGLVMIAVALLVIAFLLGHLL
jgi:LPXTG-motif cell wall-anchored protein